MISVDAIGSIFGVLAGISTLLMFLILFYKTFVKGEIVHPLALLMVLCHIVLCSLIFMNFEIIFNFLEMNIEIVIRVMVLLSVLIGVIVSAVGNFKHNREEKNVRT